MYMETNLPSPTNPATPENKKKRSRKNYPGDLRRPGTKDYSVILGNLMGYRNRLFRSSDRTNNAMLFGKIADKLIELGFKRSSNTVRARIKQDRLDAETKEEILALVLERWKDGKENHQKAKDKQKIKKKKGTMK